MSADIANTTLAGTPYNDDFDETKKFHRVLFRPSFPVQARELTQLQTILQNQVERFGNSVYKNGSIIKGCAPTVISDASYFVINDDNFEIANTVYENAVAYGTVSGVQARILKGISGFIASPTPPKFIVKYTTVGKNSNTTFQQGEPIEIYEAGQSYIGRFVFALSSINGTIATGDRIRGRTSDARGEIVKEGATYKVINVRGDFIESEIIELISNPTNVFATISSITVDFSPGATSTKIADVTTATDTDDYDAIGGAYALSVSEGVVYQKGFFVKTEEQIIVLNSSEGGPAAADGLLVGIETVETVVNEFMDSSLYDNSNSISNDNAPGAHRLKLDSRFVAYPKTQQLDEEIFFAIGEFGKNNILRWNATSLAGRSGDELAQRTYDESGHYTVKDFTVSTNTSANTEQFEYVIGEGKAYVRGNPIKFNSVQNLVSRRGTDTESPVQQIVSMNYGSYINIQELRGYFPADESVQVNLYDEFQDAITNSLIPTDVPTGNIIGTAYIRNLVFDESGAQKGSPDAKYKMYLFDVKMVGNRSFTDVRSIAYEDGTNTTNAFADIAVSSIFYVATSVGIVSGGTGYVAGDSVVVSGGAGEPATVLISGVNGSGVVTSVDLLSGGKYTITPSNDNNATLSTTGGNGSGFTLTLQYDGEIDTVLKETSYSPLVFGLTNRAVKNLKNAANTADTKFYYNLELESTLANTTGEIILSIADGGSFFGFTDGADASENKIDLVLTGGSIETTNGVGTISATNGSLTITGASGTAFTEFFVPGEKIKYGSNTAIIDVIVDNDTLLTKTPLVALGEPNISGVNYRRYHDQGSAISLSTSARTISVEPTLQSLTIDLGTSFTFTGTTAVKARVYARKVNARPIGKKVKRNQLVRFYNGSLTGTISSSTTTVTGASGTTFTTDFKEGNYIRANGQTRKIVSVASASSLVVDSTFATNLSANTYEIVHPYGLNLGLPDVFKINRVSKTDSATDDVNSNASDIQKFFTVDFGQRDTHYDHAVLYPKSTADISNTFLIVDLDCFEANASVGKGFFSVESYNVNDAIGADTSTTIKTWEIPTFYSQARQRDFDLRDSIDFRPYKEATANLTANSQLTTLNPPPSSLFNTATTDYNPFPGQNFECNFTYYIPRRDALVLTSRGEFRIIEGEAKLQPRTPNAESETQMVVATTYIPPYPSLTTNEARTIKLEPYTMKVSPSINKRFTMKDISAIEQRVSSLEYYTTLTRLEQKATQLNIPNVDGIDRFKNGIFVDPFDNHNLARLNDPEHQIVIDTLNGVGRPKVSIETINLEVDSEYNDSDVIIRNGGVAYNKNFVTVDYDEVEFLAQEHATREIPIDSDDSFLFGTLDLDKEIFSDVEQFRTYPNREYGAAYDSYETSTNYTVELIYPNTRTIKILARGLKPNAKHFIGVDGNDYSAKAIQGYIPLNSVGGEIAENIVADGVEGQELYADSNGRLYAIINLPGNIGLGTHLMVVSDVVASAISNGDCSSRAFGSFIVNSVDDISDYPSEPQPPPAPKTGIMVADFDVVGSLVVQEGSTHTLNFVNKTNRGIVAPEGSVLVEPTTFEWTFVHCSTGCVDSNIQTSNAPSPTGVEFTYSTVIETVYVKLKVTNTAENISSEVIKPIQLTKYQDNTAGIRLTIYNQLPGDNNNYYASSGSVLKATNYVHLILRADMTSNRVAGGKCKIAVVGNYGSGSASGLNFTATNVGTVEITTNDGKDNGGREVGFRWKGANVYETGMTITITATYENSAGVVIDTVQKTISWTKTGSFAPCKPCSGGQLEITPINRSEPASTPEVWIRPIGDVLTYKVR